MEELKRELEKLSKTYVDTPEKEEKILKTPSHYPGTAMDKRQV